MLKSSPSEPSNTPQSLGEALRSRRKELGLTMQFVADQAGLSVGFIRISYERLSTTFENSQLHSVIATEPPGYRSEPVSHTGEEMFYMIAGEITVEIEGETEILGPGDSIHFDSTRVHSVWNHGTQDASVLWCGTMDIFGDAPAPLHKDVTNKNDAE